MTLRYDILMETLAARDQLCMMLAAFALIFVAALYMLRCHPSVLTGYIGLCISFWVSLLVRYYLEAFGG